MAKPKNKIPLEDVKMTGEQARLVLYFNDKAQKEYYGLRREGLSHIRTLSKMKRMI